MTKKMPDQKIGERNAMVVKQYVDTVSLNQVPKNQFGKASRSKIAVDVLELPKSVLDRVDVKSYFERLDKRIAIQPGKCFVPIKDGLENVDELEKKIRNLEKDLKAELEEIKAELEEIKAELEEVKRQTLGEEWFLLTGRMLRS